MIYETYTIGGYLYHHGIRGQRWGQRNGPPYPLGDTNHSVSEKKAGWKKSLSKNKMDTAVNKVKNKNVKNIMDKEGDAIILPASLFITSLAVSTASAIGRELHRKNTNKRIEKLAQKDEERKETEKTDPKIGLKLKNEEVSEKEDLAAVNRYFKHSDAANSATSNCVYCSLTYEMRKRGYDVAAKPKSAGMNGRYATKQMFNGTKANIIDTNGLIKKYDNKKEEIEFKYDTYQERIKADNVRKSAAANRNKEYARAVIKNVEKEENSRGSMFVQWGVGGGHAMSYKVENGKLTIIDPQANKTFTGREAEKLLSSTWLASTMRLDNATINYKNKKMFKEAMS